MARLNDLGTRSGEIVMLNPKDIKIIPNFNYRDVNSEAVQAHINWLKQSIKERGVQEPIRVKFEGGVVTLINGECRLLACRLLRKEGLEIFIPAVTAKGDEAEILAESMTANGALPPTKLEFGAAAKRLLDYGWPKEKVAQYTPPHIAGSRTKAVRYINEAVELHEAPIAVKKAASEGIDGVKLSEPAALKIARENPLNPEPAIAAEVSKAKAEGKTEAKRPKGEGVASKAKAASAKQIEAWLRLADALADVSVDATLDRGEVIAAAEKYNEARRR